MKNNSPIGSIRLPKTKQQWKLYQQIGKLAAGMDRLPDVQEVKKNRPRTAPQDLLPMVF